MPLIYIKQATSHFVTFTQKAKIFDKDAFLKWRGKVGDEYLSIGSLTIEGQTKIASLNKLDVGEGFLNHDLHETYQDLLVEVHESGPLEGWNAGTREGLHRRTGYFIQLFCAKFNSSSFRVKNLTK